MSDVPSPDFSGGAAQVFPFSDSTYNSSRNLNLLPMPDAIGIFAGSHKSSSVPFMLSANKFPSVDAGSEAKIESGSEKGAADLAATVEISSSEISLVTAGSAAVKRSRFSTAKLRAKPIRVMRKEKIRKNAGVRNIFFLMISKRSVERKDVLEVKKKGFAEYLPCHVLQRLLSAT